MALEVNINYAEALNNLGVLCKDEGLIKEAMGCFEKCLSINPNSRNAAHNLLLSSNYILFTKFFFFLFILNALIYFSFLLFREY